MLEINLKLSKPENVDNIASVISDLIIKLSGLDSPTVNSTLTMMEMKGKVRNVGAMQYVVK